MRVVVATGGDIGTHVTRPQGPDQLTPELVGAKAQAQHGDAQDAVVRQRHLVLPEGIVDGCESLRVLNAVNLHDERVVLPPGVEIDAAVGQRADDLPFGGCDANAPTERAQVELAEGVGTVAYVENDVVERRPARALHSLGCTSLPLLEQACRRGQPLLDDQAQDERRLSVAAGPSAGVDGSHLRADTRDSRAERRGHRRAQVQSGAVDVATTVVPRQRHVDLNRKEAGQAVGDERCCSVQDGATAGLPNCGPPWGTWAEGNTQVNRVASAECPAARSHLTAHVGMGDTERVQLAAMRQPVLSLGESGDTSLALFARQPSGCGHGGTIE